MQYTGSNSAKIGDWGAQCAYGPENGELTIYTLEGPLRALPGDWIIRGVKGEYYPIRQDIFEATYDRV